METEEPPEKTEKKQSDRRKTRLSRALYLEWFDEMERWGKTDSESVLWRGIWKGQQLDW